MWYHKQTG